MGTEENLKEMYEEYRAHEKESEDIRSYNFVNAVKFFSSVVFIAHFAVLIWLLVFGYNGIHVAETTDTSGSIAFIGFGICALICWIPVGLYGWFRGFYSWTDSWLGMLSDSAERVYDQNRRLKLLEKEKRERQEFFKLYKLYQTDETFRESYNAQFSRGN